MATSIGRKTNRKIFFDKIRKDIFHNKLTQPQVDGMDIIFDEWESRGLIDLRWLAYIIATVYHETAYTMQPVAEYGKGKGHKYGVIDKETNKIYYGRGFAQITWRKNYEVFGAILGIDLVHNPDLALDCKISTDILFEGMLKGLFTGRKLSDYFNGDIVVSHEKYMKSWVSARRIINGLDKAELIAAYALKFLNALQ